MKIKKVAQTPGVLATVSTSKIDSDKDTYSCNYLNDNAVVVSPTEPSDGNVWIQKGKNLFSKQNASMCPKRYVSNGKVASSTTRNSFFIKVLPNTTYTISKAYISLFRVGVCNTMPILGTSFSTYELPTAALSCQITTGNDDNYLFITYYDTSTDIENVTEQQVLDSIQIEEGEVATSYETHIPKKIHTKTDNGYEEFYNEEPKRKVVWTNPDPTSSMGHVSAIYLDGSYVNYDELEFWCYGNTGNSSFQVSKTKPGYSTTVINFAGYTGETVGRSFTYRSDGGYTITDCYLYGASDTTPPTALNSSLIPAFIVAIKY